MRIIVSFLVGALFGNGLLLSGMTETRKVQGWLDALGDWDPAIASLSYGGTGGLIFLVAMLIGMGAAPFSAANWTVSKPHHRSTA